MERWVAWSSSPGETGESRLLARPALTPPSDFINLLTALLTLVGLAIALGSFYVAIAAYQKSVKDSDEQEKNLDASRTQLQAVVDAAIKQQEVLTKNLEISKAQLGLVEEQWKREQERQSRKPIAEISLLTNDGPRDLAELEKLSEIELPSKTTRNG
jgi:Na+-transporting methylmalonyl-CoA/oxaloacetate decarboxylase gamma subunit